MTKEKFLRAWRGFNSFLDRPSVIALLLFTNGASCERHFIQEEWWHMWFDIFIALSFSTMVIRRMGPAKEE